MPLIPDERIIVEGVDPSSPQIQEQDTERLLAKDVLTEEAAANLRQRIELLVRCELYEEIQVAAMRSCLVGYQEPGGVFVPPYLFFLRMFANIFEPRNPPGLQKLPMYPYPFQVEELRVIHKAVCAGLGVVGIGEIILWLKSRDMGMTWLLLLYFLWDFLFNKGSFHIGSFKEEEVDKLGTLTTLYGKLRFALYGLPKWIRPHDLVDKTLLLSYDNNAASITGESANEGFGRSKRVKAGMLDEFQQWENDRAAFQSMSQTTNTIFLVGTPLGYGNYYSEIARKKQVPAAQVRKVHWTLHPLKAKDLEYIGNKATSTWYRNIVRKYPPEVVAAEVDLSFESSIKGPVFADIYAPSHQKRGLKLIPDLPVIRAWDPGGWFATVLLQVTKKRRVIFYREVLTHGATLKEHTEEVLKVSEELARDSAKNCKTDLDWNAFYVFKDVGDPSGASVSKANQPCPEYTSLFDDFGIIVDYMFMAEMPTDLRVRSRILQYQNCMQRFLPDKDPDEDGPALWIDIDGCPTLDEAMRGGYRREVDKQGNILDRIAKRQPYNDVVDAGGYGIVSELGIPEQLKRLAKQKREEEIEDEDPYGEYGYPFGGARSRC